VLVLAAFTPAPEPFIALMALGFLVGTAGHVYKNQWAVGIGIAMVFMATLLLPLLAHSTR
jgi:hypothetical protein